MTTKLADYQNGNTHVTLYRDGTKVREYEGTPAPVHPESIDMKITDWCDAGCAFCHESSTVKGKHAKVDDILAIINGLPAGVELAIGGGDPLSHPLIFSILQDIAHRGLIANVTVNGQHIYRHARMIQNLRQEGILHGLGVSFDHRMWHDYGEEARPYSEEHGEMQFDEIADENTIVHFIAGEHDPFEALNVMRVHPKLLVLGYKQFGRGIHHFGPRVAHSLGAWKYWINSIMSKGVVCFDNLAIEQLKLQERLPAETWNRCYMGGDGVFTMYADAVRNEYAISSTSSRFPALGQSAVEFFRTHKFHVSNS
jgi:hypothetical protein